ncbi:MAG: short-chain dehydrogenase [Acidimicrobiales bacterium]|nr:short-chain dehydrogenase [Acidimicrobiales bacterium]
MARILIVGASSGIGRTLGLHAAARGDTVAFAARRRELVDAAAAEAGGGAIGLVCDVRDEASCTAVVADTVAAFGGLDAIVYATAIDVLVRIGDASAATWTDTFATNVFGAGLVTAAALPHLKESKGRAVYVSASSVDRPLPGMGVYASSKAALETMVRAWQSEHPDLCFATVRVGSALGTGVTDSWDRDLLMELSAGWGPKGYVHDNGPGGPMTVDQAASAILAVLDSPVWLREVTAVSDPGRDNYQL